MSQLLENAKRNIEVLRNKRARLFKAFDIYKENVNYGLIQEDEETHNKLTAWYLNCLELDYESITNCPSEIERYL